MTPFSTLLSLYIKNKDIHTHQLAQYCGVDRSNMYKLINGKRNPASEQLVYKIADFIKLSPSERNELLEAYKITIIGYDTYYRRKNAQQFITNFSNSPTPVFDFSTTITTNFENINEQEYLSVTNNDELYGIIYSILAKESQKVNGYIQLILQPDSGYFMAILSYICKNKCNLKIEHIICLTNTSDITTKKLHYNLNCLQKILPMYYTCKCNYIPLSYYDNITSHNSIFNLFSSMIITSDYALIFSPILQYGILFLQPDTLQNFYQIFIQLKAEASPILRKIEPLATQHSCFHVLNTCHSPVFSFQQQPCIFPLLPITFLEKYVSKELPGRAAFICSAAQYIKENSENFLRQNSRFIFTENGIQNFLKTGRIFEFPGNLCKPLERKDRLIIIRNLMTACKTNKYYMLRPNAPIATSKLCIYTNSQQGYLLFAASGENLVYLNLEESSLLTSFYDYLESLNTDWFYSPEEAVEILKIATRSKPK